MYKGGLQAPGVDPCLDSSLTPALVEPVGFARLYDALHPHPSPTLLARGGAAGGKEEHYHTVGRWIAGHLPR